MSNAELRKKTGMRGQSKSNLLSGKQCGYLLVLIFFCLFAVMPSIAGVDNVAYWAPWVTKTTTNSAAINWLGVNLGSGTVDYATSSYYNEHQSFEKTIASQITGSYQHIQLTDLEPNTPYIYRVRPSDNADAFSNRTFRTMPVSGPFTFIVISDAHAQDKRFKYVADAIAANETDALFILDGGDYANYDDESLWTPFFQDGDGMLAKFPLFTSIGNHEYHDPTSGATEPTAAVQYHSSFNIPTNGALNYFFDCSGIRFIILNSPDPNSVNDEDPSLALSQSQAPWLESLLKKSMLGVFTIHHHPIWHYGRATSDSALQPWETLYHQYHISANFAGHIHNYERLSVLGIPYFVIGNAGGKFADLTAGDAYPVWYVKGITRSLGYLKVTVDPAKNTATAQEILVGYVETDDSETVIPIDPPFTYDTITFPLASKSSITTVLANNQSQSIAITDNTPLSVTAALDPGSLSGQNADWWVAAYTPVGPYSLTPSGWSAGINMLAQAPLVKTSPEEVFNGYLPVGDYTFYFGVDMSPDGILNEPLYYDGVQVHVTLDTTQRNRLIFISDLHMNVNANYSWLVDHADDLAQFLNQVNARDDVAELVILGDLLDDWVSPVKDLPQAFADILAASNNAGIVAALQAVCRNPSIKVTYVVGNHDMLSFEDLNKAIIANAFPGMNIISESPGIGAYTKNDVIWAEHGHRYCLFNAPDTWSRPGSHLPMGYFISRFAASKAASTGQVTTTPDLLKIFIKPPGETGDIFDDAAVIALFNATALWSGNWPWDKFSMNQLDGYDTDPSVENVAFTYDTIFSDWATRQDRVSQVDAVLNDMGNLTSAADLIFEMPDSLKDKYPFKPRIILFGHTHQAAFQYNSADVDTIYANTGTWIDSKPMTWAEIQITAGNRGQKLYEVSLWFYGEQTPRQIDTITVNTESTLHNMVMPGA